jgi:triacylglycerol lipase
MRRLKGAVSLIHEAVDHTVDLVALGHDTTARTVMRFMGGPLAAPAAEVDAVRAAITKGVLDSVRGTNHAIRWVTSRGLDLLPDGIDAPPVPLRSDAVRTVAGLVDAAVGAANGVVGDHLLAQGNGLDLGMALRTVDAWITPAGDGLPATASPRIVVLIHGLAATEWSWCLDAERQLGDPTANFGTLLQRDLGYAPVYARYNTGRHISENGAALAERLAALVAAWPVPVEELVLVGHSMGGLVARAALHVGAGQGWTSLVHRVVTLSSPLQGAPLAKLANATGALLGAVDLPAPAILARILRGRSAGIKDLRQGAVQAADWDSRDPDAWATDAALAASLPAHVAWCFISATVTQAHDHPFSQAVGDLLVRVASASGPADAPARVTTHHVGGVHHAAVQVSPAAYAVLRDFLAPAEPPAKVDEAASG